MKQVKRTLALLLVLVTLMGLMACSAKQETTATAPEATPTPALDAEAAPEEKVTLTITSWFPAENQGQIYMDAW